MKTVIVPFLTLIATLISAQSMAAETAWYLSKPKTERSRTSS